jgi:dolichol kinase
VNEWNALWMQGIFLSKYCIKEKYIMIIIGVLALITLFSIELQVRRMNKSNERVVELLEEMKEKGCNIEIESYDRRRNTGVRQVDHGPLY